jgi:nicotinamidase-related amidase
MAHPVVVVVDVQERLFNAVDAERRDDMVTNVKILVSAARRVGVPVLVTEQYPKGLGKTAFSCAEADGFMERLRALGAEHVILTGIEAHVCVLLTALDLLTRGLRVSIVADAVCSRRPANLEIGLGQARQAGAVVTATETVVVQLLGSADSDAFRELSKLLR